MTMKCDFCNQEFPESELETKTGAAWIDENTGRRVENETFRN